MPFDPRNTAHLAQLRTELLDDPLPVDLGYAPLVAAGNDAGLADIINFKRNGSTPCPVNNIAGAAIQVWRNDIDTEDIPELASRAEFTGLNQGQRDWVMWVTGGRRLDLNRSSVRNGLFALLPSLTTPLTAAGQVTGSRAEQLWGYGTMITHSDVSAALASTRAIAAPGDAARTRILPGLGASIAALLLGDRSPAALADLHTAAIRAGMVRDVPVTGAGVTDLAISPGYDPARDPNRMRVEHEQPDGTVRVEYVPRPEEA